MTNLSAYLEEAMKMYIGGKWVETAQTAELFNPYNGEKLTTVPVAGKDDVEAAIVSAQRGAQEMKELPYWKRSEILHATAENIRGRKEEMAKLLTLENGKTINESRAEISRTADTFDYAADAAKNVCGEMLPLAGYKSAGVEKKLSFTYRVPVGVVLSIAPFNAPVNLAAHKLAAAIAGGNAVILKPASATPLASAEMVKALLESGLPAEAIQYITMPGSKVGDWLCTDKRIRKIAFTGSYEVGEQICKLAGLKKVTMELGGNAPVIVMPDYTPDVLLTALLSAFKNAGQACTSPQRIIVQRDVYEQVIKMLADKLATFVEGNPLDDKTSMGVVIRPEDADRIMKVFEDAKQKGARIVCGGTRKGNYVAPTIVADVKPDMDIYKKELFGPAVGFMPFDDLDEAIRIANDTEYGLAAALFTHNLETIMKVSRNLHFGMLNVNASSNWRLDFMPFGGLGDSGLGKEGAKYAIESMQDSITVTLHTGEKVPC